MSKRVFPEALHLPCGGVAIFDHDSGISYRCTHCLAVVGSVGQSSYCKDAAEKYRAWQTLGGKGWDYINGCEKT